MSELGIAVDSITVTFHTGMARRWSDVRMLREPAGVTLFLDAQRVVHVPTPTIAYLEWTLVEGAPDAPGS